MFELLVRINCFSRYNFLKKLASNFLERLYCCEINCIEIDKSILFAHHARGCTILAAKICENVVILQNVTIGTNQKYNKLLRTWENIGNPIIGRNVVIADGAKILGPITIGQNSFVAAGSIITKSIPENSIAYGINKFKEKENNFDYVYNKQMIDINIIIKNNKERIDIYKRENGEL